jgi:hypothetical protein
MDSCCTCCGVGGEYQRFGEIFCFHFQSQNVDRLTTFIEAAYSSEILVTTHMTIKCHNPNEHILNLRSYFEVTTKVIKKNIVHTQSGNPNLGQLTFRVYSTATVHNLAADVAYLNNQNQRRIPTLHIVDIRSHWAVIALRLLQEVKPTRLQSKVSCITKRRPSPQRTDQQTANLVHIYVNYARKVNSVIRSIHSHERLMIREE